MQCAWLAKIYPEKELVVHDEPQRAVPCRCGVRGGAGGAVWEPDPLQGSL